MIDEIFDREYQAGRDALNDGLAASFARIGRGLSDTFRVSRNIHYSAPWQNRSDASCA